MSRSSKDLPCKVANRRSPVSSRCKQKSSVRSSRYCKKALARIQYQGVTVFRSALTQEKCNNDLLTKRRLLSVSGGSLLVGASHRVHAHASQHPRHTDLLSFPKETYASALAIPTRAVLVVITWRL